MDVATFVIFIIIVIGTLVSVLSFANIKRYAQRASHEQQIRVVNVAHKVEANRQQLEKTYNNVTNEKICKIS